MRAFQLICLYHQFFTLDCVKDLYLIGFTSVTGRVWPGGGALLPAFEMAIHDINNRTDILSDYKLTLLLRDTQVIRATRKTNIMTSA